MIFDNEEITVSNYIKFCNLLLRILNIRPIVTASKRANFSRVGVRRKRVLAPVAAMASVAKLSVYSLGIIWVVSQRRVNPACGVTAQQDTEGKISEGSHSENIYENF